MTASWPLEVARPFSMRKDLIAERIEARGGKIAEIAHVKWPPQELPQLPLACGAWGLETQEQILIGS